MLTDELPDAGAPCPTRDVLDRIGDAWSVLVVVNLKRSPCRFNQLRRQIRLITQRMLTVTLRHLERDGLVRREVFPTKPPQVLYSLTPLGESLADVVNLLSEWAFANADAIQTARQKFDQQEVLPAPSLSRL